MIKINHSKFGTMSKWLYFLKGAKELNIEVKENESLTKELQNIPPRQKAGCVLLEIQFDNKKKRVWLDLGAFIKRWHLNLVGKDELYFKVKYNKELEKDDRVFPLAQSTASLQYFKELDKLRAIKEKCDYKYDIIAILKDTNKIRKDCCRFLRKQNYKSFVKSVNVNPNKSIPTGTKKLPYIDHLKEQAKSKLCISIDEKGGIGFRDVEIIGIGACLFKIEHPDFTGFKTNKKYYISIPAYEKNGELKFKKEELIEKIDYYLTHNKEREQIARNGLEIFEKYYTPTAMVEWVVNKTKERL